MQRGVTVFAEDLQHDRNPLPAAVHASAEKQGFHHPNGRKACAQACYSLSTTFVDDPERSPPGVCRPGLQHPDQRRAQKRERWSRSAQSHTGRHRHFPRSTEWNETLDRHAQAWRSGVLQLRTCDGLLAEIRPCDMRFHAHRTRPTTSQPLPGCRSVTLTAPTSLGVTGQPSRTSTSCGRRPPIACRHRSTWAARG